MLYGKHCIRSYSSTQAIIALSSGEAEYYGCVKAASVGLGMQAMYADFGLDVKVSVSTDASTAKAIAIRKGLGKVRHMAVHLLWLQERVALGSISIHKILGANNPADILVKYVSKDLLDEFINLLGLRPETGRAVECPQLPPECSGLLPLGNE